MKELGRFDPDHEMFVEPVKTPDINHLIFLRSLAEQGKFGYAPYSGPRGDNVFRLSNVEIKKHALLEADRMNDRKMRQHLAANGDY